VQSRLRPTKAEMCGTIDHEFAATNSRCLHTTDLIARDFDLAMPPTPQKAGKGRGDSHAPSMRPAPFRKFIPLASLSAKPSVGLEPTTPSLPWKCSTS
jgi:hypothetical protein